MYLGVSHASHPKTAEFQGLPNFAGFPVFMPQRLTQNDQIQHGSKWGGRVFGSATPLHLHKCVARFVSNSRVSHLYK